MTQDKAREYFSAYHEGTLEPGLRASLERRLATDSDLKAELNAYVETVALLDAMRHEAVASPAYLSERIAARLDTARVLTPARPFWAGLFDVRPAGPRLAWGVGVAALLLVSAFRLRDLRTDAPSQQAGVAATASEGVNWTSEGRGLVARFEGGPARRVFVQPEGGAAKAYDLAQGQRMEVTLTNPNATAQRFRITVGKLPLATVALPGDRRASRKAGSGTVTEFASALADAYAVPVVVKDVAFGTTIVWSFDSSDPHTAAQSALHDQASAILTPDNVLKIGQ